MNELRDMLTEERDELQVRISALDDFITTNPVFKGLSQDEQIRMIQQLGAMTIYRNILTERIENEQI